MTYEEYEDLLKILKSLPHERILVLNKTYLTEYQGKAYLFSMERNIMGLERINIGYLTNEPTGKYYLLDEKRSFVFHNEDAPAAYNINPNVKIMGKFYYIHGIPYTEKNFERIKKITNLKNKLKDIT